MIARLTIILAWLSVLIAPVAAAAENAVIAVAANFKDAADALAADFEAKSGHDIAIVAGSTGKLYAQIINGAPFDIFLAADQERPRLLEDRHIAAPGSRFTYATGRLVLWSREPARLAGDGALVLLQGDFNRLAIANPDLAPYGAAAKDVLIALRLWDALEAKVVMGENVAQSFAFVATGAAELGFTALSHVLVSADTSRGSYWTPAADLYSPIRQDAVLLQRATDNAAANAFFDYLKTDEARSTIIRFGYGGE